MVKIDEIKDLLKDEAIQKLISEYGVETISAFGFEISGHTFRQSGHINLIIAGKGLSYLGAMHFDVKFTSYIDSKYTGEKVKACIYTKKYLESLVDDGYVSQEFFRNANQYAEVVYNAAEEKKGDEDTPTNKP